MSTQPNPEQTEAYLTAMRAAVQGQWPEALATVRPLADQGDHAAAVLTAQYLLNSGNVVEGIPYARTAAGAGNGIIAQNYFGHLWSLPEHKAEAMEFLKLSLESGYPGPNPVEHAPAAVQEGREDLAIELLRLSAATKPAPARAAWEELVVQAEGDGSRINAAAAEVDSRQAMAIEKIQAAEKSFEEDRERVRRLVDETDQLVHEASAATLAREYGRHAVAEEERADRFTRAAIGAGFVAAIGTIVIAYFAFTSDESGVGAVLTKGALTIPLILFAGYLARLAGQFRKKAWSWRHVELQIQTSEPFIALLDDQPRKALLAALALRFFPGQSQVPDGDVTADMGDPAELLSSLGLSTPFKKEVKAPDSVPDQPEGAA